MAYRVISASGKRARPSASQRRGDGALTRNTVITGAALSCVALIAAGAALFSGNREFAALPGDGARSGSLRVALVDPAPQRIVKHDPAIPIETSERPAPTKVIAEIDTDADAPPDKRELPARARKADRLPVAPPPKIVAIAPPPKIVSVPLPRERLVDVETTGSLGKPTREAHAAPAKPPRPPTPHEKLFGPVRLAALTPADTARDTGVGLPRAPYDRQTAVYVITDKTVYMPDGTALEAHSGLGSKMDDPRFVHVRMRGATPPHVYDLTMRESLFHGVEAIRLNPIGGKSAIFGRDGLLAHTYLLGPRGDSNGCVSFKDYEAFLKAFKAGKITRLAVIAQLD